MNMKSFHLASAVLAAALASSAQAAVLPVGPKAGSFLGYNIENVSLQNDNLVTDVALDFSQVDLPRNNEVIFTPMWVNGPDTVAFDSFAVAGRSLYYYDIRNGQRAPYLFKGWGKDKGEVSKESEPFFSNLLSLSTPYRPWLENATFILDVQDLQCATCRKGENEYPLAQTDFTPRVYEADFIYITPVAEAVKMREISARAYIDFVVNRTEINPNYRRNPVELAKIRATIDSVRNDKDITVKNLHIFGTASPEGPYDNNIRLAKGRTASLKDYVQNLYQFPEGVLTTSYEPVDWQGLAQFLRQVLGIKDETLGNDSIRQDQFAANNQFVTTSPNTPYPTPHTQYPTPNTQYLSELPHAAEILRIVDGDLEPYARNSKIKSTYPKEYAWLLANVYPALRHSDYRIQFEIKQYSDVAEIIEVMQSQPQKLSLSEFFLAAQSQEEGSELYNEAMEIAVRMYPNDPVANLNAGLAAMKRGDYISAQKYLAKAGNVPEADYAKAVLTELQGNDEEAYRMFLDLKNSSNAAVREKSRKAAEQIAAKINFKGNFTTLM